MLVVAVGRRSGVQSYLRMFSAERRLLCHTNAERGAQTLITNTPSNLQLFVFKAIVY